MVNCSRMKGICFQLIALGSLAVFTGCSSETPPDPKSSPSEVVSPEKGPSSSASGVDGTATSGGSSPGSGSGSSGSGSTSTSQGRRSDVQQSSGESGAMSDEQGQTLMNGSDIKALIDQVK